MTGEGFYKLLTSDGDVSALIGDRMYADVLPKGAELPAIAWTIIHGGSINSMIGENNLRPVRIQFDGFAGDPYTARQVTGAIRNLFKTFQSTLPDGTDVQSSFVNMDMDLGYTEGEGGVVFRTLLDISFLLIPAN